MMIKKRRKLIKDKIHIINQMKILKIYNKLNQNIMKSKKLKKIIKLKL